MPDYLKFFDERAFTDNLKWAGCYCYFPLHDPAKTDWHKRSGAENKAAVSRCIARGEAKGYLAYIDGEVAGWCNAGPWSQFPMLAELPEPDTSTLGVVFCFVVAPEMRGQGIARALLEAACEGLGASGMTAVQAKPTRQAESAAANHLGPLTMYLDAGFSIIRETGDGDVFVRKALVLGPATSKA